MVKKKIKGKRIRKKAKKEEINLVYILLSIVVVIMIMWGVALFLLEQMGITLRPQDQTPVTPGTISNFACESNSECFIVRCESRTVTECVNTTEMINYYKKCEAWGDFRLETQDFSKCACINGFCKSQ